LPPRRQKELILEFEKRGDVQREKMRLEVSSGGKKDPVRLRGIDKNSVEFIKAKR